MIIFFRWKTEVSSYIARKKGHFNNTRDYSVRDVNFASYSDQVTDIWCWQQACSCPFHHVTFLRSVVLLLQKPLTSAALSIPRCGHCKKLLPTLNKVAPFIKGKMAIGTIDCTREDALCKRFDVTGFPTLKFYRDGSFYDYPGKRDADSIIDFAEKMSKPAVRMVGSLEEALKDVAGTNPENVAFLMYDPQGKANDDVEKLMQTTTDLQVWNQVGRKIQAHASFAVLRPEVTADTVKKFGVGSAGPFLIKIERDVDPIVYEGEVNSPDVLDFVKKHNVALVTKLGPDNFRATGTLGKPLAIGVVDYEDKEGRTERLLSEITRFAKSGPPEIRDKFLYAHMDAKKWASFLKKFGVNTNDLPDFFVLDVPTRKFWKEEKEENAVFDPGKFLKARHRSQSDH